MSDKNAPGRTIPPPLDIRALRDRLGLTGQALADIVNARLPGAAVSRQTVWKWESGYRQISAVYAEVIRQIAKEHQG